MADFSLPSEMVTFRIGGQEVEVPTLTFAIMEKAKESILALGPDLNFIDYAQHVLHIIAIARKEYGLEADEAEYKRFCSLVEMRLLAPSMNKLLGISMGEAEATGEPGAGTPPSSPGTGTSEPSSQNSPDKESAAGTSNGSKGLIH